MIDQRELHGGGFGGKFIHIKSIAYK
jgi:hypothetical protein